MQFGVFAPYVKMIPILCHYETKHVQTQTNLRTHHTVFSIIGPTLFVKLSLITNRPNYLPPRIKSVQFHQQ